MTTGLPDGKLAFIQAVATTVRTSLIEQLATVGGVMLLVTVISVLPPVSSRADELTFSGYDVSPEVWDEITQEWVEEVLATYPAGTWAPLKLDLTDSRLAKLGLPPRDVLLSHRFSTPTMVSPDGTMVEDDLVSFTAAASAPVGATYAGLGCFGIRPGAWLIVTQGNTIGLCSMAHVYGKAISTAGHCGEPGANAIAIGAAEYNGKLTPVLLEFGQFSTSTHAPPCNVLENCDPDPGPDWALISVDSRWQSLVSPTMCFWGGPQGKYTKTGSLVSLSLKDPETADPTLAQVILHYGHGLGVGTGGTPRVGLGPSWGPEFFTFFGAISPGDSGSGANVLAGSPLGKVRQAAGIITHIWVDSLMREGVGIMLGTRVTKVGTPTNGQLLPYPIPAPGLP